MTRRLRLLLRLLTIQRTLIRHGLEEIAWTVHLFRPLAWVSRLLPRRRVRRTPLGVRIRLALEELGPIFVKFGQAVSTRRDLLAPAIAEELAKLQDQVPPFPSSEAVEILERAFGCPVEEVFAELDRQPLAAASIAQVHAARLKTGESVVVKLLRPDVRTMIRRDVEVLHAVAELTERYWSDARRLHPVEVVAEFEKTLVNELDLTREAANAAQLKRNFADSDKLYVPTVYWDYCRPSVLTMERVSGVPISDVAALEAHRVNIKRLAENGVEIFFTQVFRHNFFHADMHPGNIFVDISDPERPRYIAVDFGIVGSLSSRDQHYLAENFLAFFERDYRRVASLHVDSGWVPAETRVDELEAAVRAVCEPIFNKPLKDISFGLLLLRLFDTARQFNMEVQPQLVLLQKTLLSIEGLGRQLYPQLDLWKTAKPVLEDWMRQRTDPRTQLAAVFHNWRAINADLLLLPQLAHRLLRAAEARLVAGEPRAHPGHPARRPRRPYERLLSGGALLIGGVLWSGLEASPLWLGWASAGVGLLLMFRPGRDGRRG